MANSRVILRVLLVLVSITLLVAIIGCKGNTGPLEDVTDQVKFDDISKEDLYYSSLADGSSRVWHVCVGLEYVLALQVNADTRENVPERPVWVWTIFLNDSLLTEIVHDSQPVSAGTGSSGSAWERWPYNDFIEYEFTAEGTYRIRTDMYDRDEYASLKELAPCCGSYTQTLDCKQVRASITAMSTGEPREYNIFCQVTPLAYRPNSGNYDATLRIINNETGVQEQLIGDHCETGFDYFEAADAGVTYRFQSEGDYRLIYTLDYGEHGYIKGGICLREEVLLSMAVTSAEYTIQAPYFPISVGEEYTFRVLKKGAPAEAPYYVWDFGDGEGISMPYSNEATHAYQNEGTYWVLLNIYSSIEEDALLLGTAIATVEVEDEGMTIIKAYQNVKQIYIHIITEIWWQFEEGKEFDPDASEFSWGDVGLGYTTPTSNEIAWNGTEFEIHAADRDFTCTGQISDDGSKLLFLDAYSSWESGGITGSSHYYLTNVPLTTSTGVSGPPDAIQLTDSLGYYRFEFSANGADVQSYISTQAHHFEMEYMGKDVAKNYYSWNAERADRNHFEITFYN